MPTIAQRPKLITIAQAVAIGQQIEDRALDSACRAGGVSRAAFDAVVQSLANDTFYDAPPAQAATKSPPSQTKGTSQVFNLEKAYGTSSSAFWSEVESRIRQGMPRARAIEQVVMQDPDLHQAMLAEINAAR